MSRELNIGVFRDSLDSAQVFFVGQDGEQG